MKITLSKNQWEEIGKVSGWMKESQTKPFHVPNIVEDSDPNLMQKLEEAYLNGWEAREQYLMGEHMVINPELKTNLIGRAWLLGWNDSSPYKEKKIRSDLLEYVKSDVDIKIS